MSVAALLESGAYKVDFSGEDGATPLFAAAQAGHAAVVLLLVSAGAEVDAAVTSLRRTPLLIASMHDHITVVAALVEAGAEVDKAAYDGGTALYAAALKGIYFHDYFPSDI
jgi:ankyrin repeat protein